MVLWVSSDEHRFNPHAREGVTLTCGTKSMALFSFNPHAREGVTLHSLTYGFKNQKTLVFANVFDAHMVYSFVFCSTD